METTGRERVAVLEKQAFLSASPKTLEKVVTVIESEGVFGRLNCGQALKLVRFYSVAC